MTSQKLLPVEAHFNELRKIKWTPYGAEGLMPVSWADLVLHRWQGFDPPLPARRQTRNELRDYCQHPKTPPMHAFIAIMAWGVQMPRSRKYREAIKDNEACICYMLAQVRLGSDAMRLTSS